MNTSEEGIKLLHHFEGLRLDAYPDPATGGPPWTIGYGNTGPDVYQGLSWSREKAEVEFAKRLSKEFEPGVLSALKIDPSQSEFDAMVSLAYNIGVGAFIKSTLVKKYNYGDLGGAADEFLEWDNAAGKSMLGLRKRRSAERARFIGATAAEAIAIGEQTK